MLPKKELKMRTEDIKYVLIPELIPDQLRLLGITDFDGEGDEFNKARLDSAQGIEWIKLLINRVEKVLQEGGLYKDRETFTQASQLSYVKEALSRFMQQATFLNDYFPIENPANANLYSILDRLTFLALSAGYFAGNNDALAITDRYVNFGYQEKVTKPQSGGHAKSKKTEPIKKLVTKIAEYSFSHESLHKIPKSLLAEAIYELINDFVNKNHNTAALKTFKNNSPEVSTIDKWLKPIKKQKIKSNLETPSQNKTLELLKKEFPNKVIKNFLK